MDRKKRIELDQLNKEYVDKLVKALKGKETGYPWTQVFVASGYTSWGKA